MCLLDWVVFFLSLVNFCFFILDIIFWGVRLVLLVCKYIVYIENIIFFFFCNDGWFGDKDGWFLRIVVVVCGRYFVYVVDN